jgi:RNA polymerase sigma-70 factor (ECF subfamily)
MPPAPEAITQLLAAWSAGDRTAFDMLIPLVHNELRRRARQHLRGQPRGHTIESAVLINEAYLKLVNTPEKQWENRAHFFAVASRVMRQVSIDYARSRLTAKRGGRKQMVSLDDVALFSAERAFEEVALDDALKRLEAIYPRHARVVEMRHYGGLTYDEISKVLNVSPETVMRDWSFARAWLLRELSGGQANDG